MLCLNELRFYTWNMLGGIFLSTICCIIGISILLEKNKEKRAAINTVENGDDGMEQDDIIFSFSQKNIKFTSFIRDSSLKSDDMATEGTNSVEPDLHMTVQPQEDKDDRSSYDQDRDSVKEHSI